MDVQELQTIVSDGKYPFPPITEAQAMTAYLGSLIKIQDQLDAFYFFACMNLLNAYVKKPDAGKLFLKRYVFKKYLIKGLETVITKRFNEVKIFLDNNICYVSVLGLQFSFHEINYSKLLKEFKNSSGNNKQEWCGIRLQPAASLIFDWACQLRQSKGRLIK